MRKHQKIFFESPLTPKNKTKCFFFLGLSVEATFLVAPSFELCDSAEKLTLKPWKKKARLCSRSHEMSNSKVLLLIRYAIPKYGGIIILLKYEFHGNVLPPES